jgi:hypothetical protein
MRLVWSVRGQGYTDFKGVWTRRVITLPFYTSVTQDEMDYVVDALAEYEEGRHAAAGSR